MERAEYVWGLGLSRTGTTSLSQALEKLGYPTIHYPYKIEDLEGYRAASDIPILLWLEAIDRKYPNSKFVWTERDIGSWLASCEAYFQRKQNPTGTRAAIRQACYGCTEFDEKKFRTAYYRHGAYVMSYFESRPNDFLSLRILDGEGWNELCPFLGYPFPKEPFPNLNKKMTATRLGQVKRFIKTAVKG